MADEIIIDDNGAAESKFQINDVTQRHDLMGLSISSSTNPRAYVAELKLPVFFVNVYRYNGPFQRPLASVHSGELATFSAHAGDFCLSGYLVDGKLHLEASKQMTELTKYYKSVVSG